MNKLTELETLIYKLKLTTQSGETLSLCGFRKHDRRIIAQDETGAIHILNRHEVNHAGGFISEKLVALGIKQQ